jgi:hypothetical protein
MTTRILLTLLCVFTFTTSASAAWVLWSAPGETRDGQTMRGPWEPHSGAESLDGCRRAMVQTAPAKNAPHDEKGWIETNDMPDGSTYFRNLSRPGSGTYYKCLPDTIDPRGPKGK